MKRVNTLLCVSLVSLAAASTANPLLQARGVPGFVVLAEQRYDPAVQRFMAEQSLAALPLQGGQLFYVYPQNTSNAYIEQMQIRYLEALLQENRVKSEPTED